MQGRVAPLTFVPRVAAIAAACLAAMGAVVCSGRAAWAQTPSEIAAAKRWFADGFAREEKGEYAAALDLFRRAAEVKRTPQIVYHVGFCESRTGALVEALVDLESATSLGRAARLDDVVAAAQAELAEVKRRVPSLEVHVPEGAKPARVVLDGRAVATSMLTTAMLLDPGEHTVTIEFPSGSATKVVKLAERDAQEIELAPPAVEAPAVAAPAPALAPARGPGPAPGEPRRSPSALPWIAIGVGGALAVGGTVVFVVARGKESALNDQCRPRTNCDPALESDYDAAKTFNALGLALGAVGIVTAGVGVSMLALRPSPGATASLVVGPDGARVVGRF